MDCKQLSALANTLFGRKLPINSLWQEISDNFFPERADFTIWRPNGTDFAANLMTSYPVMCRRDLANQLSTMLRPTARPWFHTGIRHKEMDSLDNRTKAYLEWFEETQRRAMYDPATMFTRATKEGDHDFATFGQCVISVELNRKKNALLYRTWHLRDCAWQENDEGNIGPIFRKWKPTAYQLCQLFPKTVDKRVTERLKKSPFDEIECLHMRVDADQYDGDARGRPYWSIYYDTMHETVLEAVPIWNKHYIIPRWVTVSSTVFGSQYAYSPAVVAALPDARLIQAMTYTLLEAGEKATQPPMVATVDAVRSDVALYAGGITWVDPEYDERLGDALRPLNQDFRGFNFGVEMNKDCREMISKAFYLDMLTLPERGPEMTAYEIGQRVQEYIRNALPIFEPMEMEYNAGICDETFELLWRNGAFGDPRSWPKTLRGAEIDFHFESPLHDAIDQQKGQKFEQAQQLIAQAVSLDPSAAYVPKTVDALRDALTGIGIPAKWMNDESYVADKKAEQEQQERQEQLLASMEQGSNVAKNLGQSGLVQQPQQAVNG